MLPSASTRISLGPAIMSMPTSPKTRRFAGTQSSQHPIVRLASAELIPDAMSRAEEAMRMVLPMVMGDRVSALEKVHWHDREFSVRLTLPALSAVILKPAPADSQDLYLKSLTALGIEPIAGAC